MNLRAHPIAIVLLMALIAFGACASSSSAAPDPIVRGTTTKGFDDVIIELEFAITERNFRITGRNTIGKSLRERGYEDFPDVEVIHFCNLEHAREVLLLDPGYVTLMPCRMTVHEEGGKTVVSLVLLPEAHPDPRVVAFAKRMNVVLREILAYVLEEK